MRDGTSFIIVASLYGHSGSSWDPALARVNDRLVKAAVLRASQFITTPYYLCCDLNQDPDTSLTVSTAVDAGILVDVAADWSRDKMNLAPTFRKEGVYQGMSGTGTTRIDVVLANITGSAAVARVDTVWDRAILFDHTPIRVRLSMNAMTQKVNRPGRPIGIDVDKCAFKNTAKGPAQRKQRAEKAAKSFGDIWKLFAPSYYEAIDKEDIDEAHRWWCLGCELWLYLQHEDKEPGGPCIQKFLMKGVPRRGQPMPVRQEPLVPPVDQGPDSAILAVSKQLLQIVASIKGVVLVLEQAKHREGHPLDERTAGIIGTLLKRVITFAATNRSADDLYQDSEKRASGIPGEYIPDGKR